MDAPRPLSHGFRGLSTAMAVISGIVLSRAVAPPERPGWLLGLVLLACVVIARRSSRTGLAVLVFGALSFVRTPQARPGQPVEASPLGELVTVRGRVLDVPITDRSDNTRRYSVRFTLEELDHGLRTPRRYSVRTSTGESRGRTRVPRPGDFVQLRARLFRERGPRFPGERLSTWRRGLVGTLTIPDVCGVEAIEGLATTPEVLLGRLRERLHRTIEERFSPPTQGLVLALVLGDRRLLSRPLRDDLVATGTYHFLAISGLHVALVMAIVLRFPIPGRFRTQARLFMLVSFVLLTGGHPPVVRAALTFAIHLILGRLGREPHALGSLGWTAVLLLGADPELLFDIGFQLSFAAVGAILLWTGPLLGRDRDHDGIEEALVPTHARGAKTGARRALTLMRRALAAALAASVAALAGTAPVSAYHFQRLHPLSPLWTLLVYPLAVVVLVGGWLSTILAGLAPDAIWTDWLSSMTAGPTELAGRTLSQLAGQLSGVPGSALRLPRPAPAMLCIATMVLTLARRPAWRLPCASVALIAIFVALGTSSRDRAPRLIHFDVGPASAALLELPPADGSFLIDAGVGSPGDARRLANALLRRGTRRLRGVFLSHAHRDHVGALPELLDTFTIDLAFVSPLFDATPTGRATLSLLRSHGVEIRRLGRGDVLSLCPATTERPGTADADREDRAARAVRIEVLHPQRGETLPSLRETPNESSLAFRVVTSSSSHLFLGDIEERGVARLLSGSREEGSWLRADVLVVPHHGRRNELLPRLFEAVRPCKVVISGNGRGGAVELLTRLRSEGLWVEATWEKGAIVAPLPW